MKPINTLPKIYRKDKFVNALYTGGLAATSIEQADNQANYNNIFFDSLDEYGASNYEYDLAIEPLTDIIDRRNLIESKWKAFEKCSVQSLQSLASRYFNNDVTVGYTGDAEVTYTARIGFKHKYSGDTYNAWLNDNNVVFPAHMIMTWIYEKNRWQDYFSKLNWGSGRKFKWDSISRTWGAAKNADVIAKTWEYMSTRSWDDTLNEEIEY